jgi:hypothetical protein
MARRRFPASETWDQNPDRSASTVHWDDSMKARDPDGDDNMEYEMSAPDFQPQQNIPILPWPP